MKINGVDITTLFGGKLEFLDYSLPAPSFNRYITTTDVDRKIPNKRTSVGIRDIIVRIAFHDTKENSYIMSSALTSILSDAIVNFGGAISYRVVISNSGEFEFKTPVLFLWTLNLQILDKMGPEILVDTTNTSVPITLNNFGTYKTPLIIEITPKSAGVTSISVAGMLGYHNTTPLTINNTSLNKKIIIDGELCRILEMNGSIATNKFLDSNLVSFPEIGPAQTTNLTITPSANLEVRITFKPRYI
jgi:hypothetical protein